MQRNTCYGSAIQLLSVYPSLAKQWKQHEDRQNSVNNCKGLCVFRCDNFLPTFRFSSNAKPLNSKFDVLMKMFLFLAVSYMYTLYVNPLQKIRVRKSVLQLFTLNGSNRMRKRCILIIVQYENEKRCIFSKEK